MSLRIPPQALFSRQPTAAGDTSPAAVGEPSHDRTLTSQEALVYWLLRIACGCEFIGHGAFGVITKAAWVPYFRVVGIRAHVAWELMPVVGSVDIFLGILVLLKPLRVVLLYYSVWGLWTALLRPLSGEPVWELVERAPNYLVPLTLLYLRGLPRSWKELVQ